MTTLKDWLNEAEKETGEKIFSIVFYPEYSWIQENIKDHHNKIFSIDAAPEHEMTYEFDDGYGGTQGPDFTAWSNNYVYFPDQYDGAESICWMPRYPMVMKNFNRPGGG